MKFRELKANEIDVRVQSVTEKGCEEEWRDIKGYEGLYQVSNLGRVKSLGNRSNHSKEKILKFFGDRYYKVKLYKNSKGKTLQVHRLVAFAFISNPLNKKEVNHIDCNRYNNKVTNLEWATRQENHYHKCVNGLNNTSKAIESTKRKIEQVNNKGETVKVYSCMSDAARELNLSVPNICNVCKGKLKHSKGYKFRYLEV